MHEEALLLHYEDIKIVIMQAFFYITIFQIQAILKNSLVSIIYGAFFMWLISSTALTILMGGVFGIVAGLLVNKAARFPDFKITRYGPYYILIQPLILYYTITLFIPQTSYPVGFIVGFILWMLGNGVVSHTKQVIPVVMRFYAIIAFPLCIVFLLGFLCYHTPWVSIGGGLATQVLLIYIFFND